MNSRRRLSRLFFRLRAAFTLVEILISILILALGVLGLGALFPVIIREQRIGSDAVTGVLVSNQARVMLSGANWGDALVGPSGIDHPARGSTVFLWDVLQNNQVAATTKVQVRAGLGEGYDPNNPASTSFQHYGQGEWFTATVDPATGIAKLGLPNLRDAWLPSGGDPTGMVKIGTQSVRGWVDLPVSQRLYPISDTIDPQFVWDFAFQRVSDFNYGTTDPARDAIRAVVFVRRIDARIRITGVATTLAASFTSTTVGGVPTRVPVAEDVSTSDALTATPTLDGVGSGTAPVYSTIKTCEVEFWYKKNDSTGKMTHRDRLYFPSQMVRAVGANDLKLRWALMKQPGQKLVDNLGNIYTVVGSGFEPTIPSMDVDGDGVAGDYLRIDPPVPETITEERSAPYTQQTTYTSADGGVQRAIWQVAYTPQIPVSVTLVDIKRGQ